MEYLLSILKFLESTSALNPPEEATPITSHSLFRSRRIGRIVVEAKLPAPIIPNLIFPLDDGVDMSVFSKSSFGSLVSSYLRTIDNGLSSDSNFSYIEGASIKSISSVIMSDNEI